MTIDVNALVMQAQLFTKDEVKNIVKDYERLVAEHTDANEHDLKIVKDVLLGELIDAVVGKKLDVVEAILVKEENKFNQKLTKASV